MAHLLLARLIMAGLLISQVPGPTSKRSSLADDPELQAALSQARASGLPHRMLLAEHIENIIEDGKYDDAKAFKTGVQSVLRHSDFSRDLVLGELYLRMLQQQVKDDVLDGYDAATRIRIDASAKDWPAEAIMVFPKPARRKNARPLGPEPLLKRFGAVRGYGSLFVVFETQKKIQPGSKNVFIIDIRKLSDQFSNPAYSVRIVGRQARLFDKNGKELTASPDEPLDMWARAKTLEIRIPLANFEKDLRSIAVRGSLTDPKTKNETHSLWVACPTGPVAYPTEMLLHFAVQRELPLGNSLPLAIALQEGLLLANSSPDLAERIRKDAYAWLELALSIDEQLDAQGLRPISSLPIAAQLAWACRYDGTAVLNSLEEYEFQVAKPGTIADLRGYAQLRGWLTDAKPAELRDHIATMIAREFKVFDFPNQKAREQGAEFEDSRKAAYIVKGKERLLSYRDIGVNRRWKLLEEGFGFKGSRQQAVEFQRLLSLAVGLPTLRADHRGPAGRAEYVLSFDGKKKKWFAAGAPVLNTTRKEKLNFAWHKPWTRPERFHYETGLTLSLPSGWARFWCEADYEEYSNKRLNSMLEKGFSNELLSKSILEPLRVRQ